MESKGSGASIQAETNGCGGYSTGTVVRSKMKLLATIRPKDVDPDAPEFDLSTFTDRTAGRAIVFDGDKVALIYIRARGSYMLPGGGIENEDVAEGLAREVMEELGCKIEIGQEVGRIDMYIDRWMKKQTDYCYVARKVGETKEPSFTEHEKAEGFEIVWADSHEEAMRLLRDNLTNYRDGKLIQKRDLMFLSRAYLTMDLDFTFNLDEAENVQPFYDLQNFVEELIPAYLPVMDSVLKGEDVSTNELQAIIRALVDILVLSIGSKGVIADPKMALLNKTIKSVGSQL